MDLHLDWGPPLALLPSEDGRIYEIDLNVLPEAPGIYIFTRTFGKATSALYVGKAENLRGRLKQQLNAVRLMKGIENAPTGRRHLLWAKLNRRQGQKADCLPIVERALIRHYLSEGHELLNIHGNRIKKHSLTSERTAMKTFIPRTLFFESH
jgi:hypothetical protein